jgi:hypothetical protein
MIRKSILIYLVIGVFSFFVLLSSIFLVFNLAPDLFFPNPSPSPYWLENDNFNTTEAWYYDWGTIGNNHTLSGNIGEGKANFNILGEEDNFLVCSGIPNNTITSVGWEYNLTEKEISGFPTIDYKIDENGCYASHEWYEGSGSPTMSDQKVSVQWDKNVNTSKNMRYYNITEVDLSLMVNASVHANSGTSGGIESLVDSPTRLNEGDYIKFYVILSDPFTDTNFKVIDFRTTNLGNDSKGSMDEEEYLLTPEDEENVIFYLNEVLKSNYRNFYLTIGIEFYCEDSYSTDRDIFDDVYITNCTFSFRYRKQFEKYSTISLNQVGEKIDKTNTKIISSQVYFTYTSDKKWPKELSPYSELRVLINQNPHFNNVKLSSINSTVKTFEIDTTKYIIKGQNITFSIEIFLANKFEYTENLKISIDNVQFLINYQIIRESQDLSPLVIILTSALGGLIIGIVSYQYYFQYPPTVRKIRKLKKKIRKNKKVKPLQLSERKNSVSLISSTKKHIIPSENEEMVKDKTIIK